MAGKLQAWRSKGAHSEACHAKEAQDACTIKRWSTPTGSVKCASAPTGCAHADVGGAARSTAHTLQMPPRTPPPAPKATLKNKKKAAAKRLTASERKLKSQVQELQRRNDFLRARDSTYKGMLSACTAWTHGKHRHPSAPHQLKTRHTLPLLAVAMFEKMSASIPPPEDSRWRNLKAPEVLQQCRLLMALQQINVATVYGKANGEDILYALARSPDKGAAYAEQII